MILRQQNLSSWSTSKTFCHEQSTHLVRALVQLVLPHRCVKIWRLASFVLKLGLWCSQTTAFVVLTSLTKWTRKIKQQFTRRWSSRLYLLQRLAFMQLWTRELPYWLLPTLNMVGTTEAGHSSTTSTSHLLSCHVSTCSLCCSIRRTTLMIFR